MTRTWFDAPCGIHRYRMRVRSCEVCAMLLSEIRGLPQGPPLKKPVKKSPTEASRQGNQVKDRYLMRKKGSKVPAQVQCRETCRDRSCTGCDTPARATG